jgi:hypothetical protein
MGYLTMAILQHSYMKVRICMLLYHADILLPIGLLLICTILFVMLQLQVVWKRDLHTT